VHLNAAAACSSRLVAQSMTTACTPNARHPPDAAWNDTSAARDYTHNNISHAFKSAKGAGPGSPSSDSDSSGDLAKVFRVMSLLQAESLFTFSAARYTAGDHIEPHDDRAYTHVLMEDGEMVECSRRVAAILYLTPGAFRVGCGGMRVGALVAWEGRGGEGRGDEGGTLMRRQSAAFP